MVLVALAALISIRAAHAQAQAAGSAAAATREPTREADDEDAAGPAAAPMVAPIDPKARVGWLHDKIAGALTAAQLRLGHARIAVAVVDLATGNELFVHEADRGMSLASTTKLLTSAAALSTLGGGFRWRTSIHGAEPDAQGVVAGPLYVKGRGDPLLRADDLRALAADLVARGVRSADGLVLDTSYFDGEVEPPHFADQPNESAGFRAPVASLGVARSTVTVVVVAEPGGAASVHLEPDAGPMIKLINKGVVSVAKGRTRLAVTGKPRGDVLELTVSGQIRWGEGSWEIRKRVSDPARFAGEVLRRALLDAGVTLRTRALTLAATPPASKILAVHDSEPLTEVLRHMNKLSDNYLAESVLKTLGAQTRATPGPATWADGRAAVHAYLERIGMPPAGYRVDNGSGLFDASEVSARQVTTVLRAAYKDYRVGPDLVASLPVGGVDGTLARRWFRRPAAGRVRAKTGTLDKVVTLAGYVALDSGHPLAFAVLVNDIPPGQRASARTAADDIIDALAAYLGGA